MSEDDPLVAGLPRPGTDPDAAELRDDAPDDSAAVERAAAWVVENFAETLDRLRRT